MKTEMRTIRKIVKSILKSLDIGITRYGVLEGIRQNERDSRDLKLLLALPHASAPQLLKYLRKSKAQWKQDLFVLAHLDFKTNGYFVEFGATNGVDLSNTYLLERDFGWTGILAEPAKCWHRELRKNRSAKIETACVWRKSNAILSFNEPDIAELSTLRECVDLDFHKDARGGGKIYDVETISLNDLLAKYDAPRTIDYLSIDTEGSEFEILNAFDFRKYSFRVITCEHNFSPLREQIYDLLHRNGYRRFFEIFPNVTIGISNKCGDVACRLYRLIALAFLPVGRHCYIVTGAEPC